MRYNIFKSEDFHRFRTLVKKVTFCVLITYSILIVMSILYVFLATPLSAYSAVKVSNVVKCKYSTCATWLQFKVRVVSLTIVILLNHFLMDSNGKIKNITNSQCYGINNEMYLYHFQIHQNHYTKSFSTCLNLHLFI